MRVPTVRIRKGLWDVVQALGIVGIAAALMVGCGETDVGTLPEEGVAPPEEVGRALAALKAPEVPEAPVVAAAPVDPVSRMVPDPHGRYDPFYKPTRRTVVDVTACFTDTALFSKQFRDLKGLVDYLERHYGKYGIQIRKLTVVDHSGTPGWVNFGSDFWAANAKVGDTLKQLRRLSRLLSPDGALIVWECRSGRTKGAQERKETLASLRKLAKLLGVPVWAPRSAVPDLLPAIEGLTVSGWTKVYPDGRVEQTGSDDPSPYERLKTGGKGKKGSAAKSSKQPKKPKRPKQPKKSKRAPKRK